MRRRALGKYMRQLEREWREELRARAMWEALPWHEQREMLDQQGEMDRWVADFVVSQYEKKRHADAQHHGPTS